jgi:CRISPR type III-A-associated RAMP protein Csm5
MSEIKIEILSPVHVGSGNLLQNNTDFVTTSDGENSYIRIVDDRKILELIGVERLNDWLLSIERKENTKELIKRYAPNSKVADYSKRRLVDCSTGVKKDDTLKECIHSGLGQPYIPGSSIKGAIRTAILASLAERITNKEEKIKTGKTDRNGNPYLSASKIEGELFGKDPNSDIFRFIHVGDAYFEKDTEIALRVVNINIRQGKNLQDNSKPQLVEAIGIEVTSTLQMKIATDYYNWAKANFANMGKLPFEINSLSNLFLLINNHTQQLVENEIEYWRTIDKTGAEDFIDNMSNILSEIKSCEKGNECVLRIGHASGWRFITGGWTEKLDNFKNVVIPASRPNNYKYTEYDFPKSRRIDEDSDVLGFVKLKI